MPTGEYVVGCVYGAHQALVLRLGDEAPSYNWCERTWERVRSEGPPAGDKAVPAWLTDRLEAEWVGNNEPEMFPEATR